MRSKTLILLIVVLGLSLTSTYAQTEDFVKQIRKDVGKINSSIPKYEKETKLVEGISLEGTQATFYSSRYGLRKIEADMYGETFRANAAFYYKNSELIFAFFEMNRYDTQVGADPPPKVVKTVEKRFYFAGGKLAKLLIDKEAPKKSSEEWKESEKEILGLDKDLRNALND